MLLVVFCVAVRRWCFLLVLVGCCFFLLLVVCRSWWLFFVVVLRGCLSVFFVVVRGSGICGCHFLVLVATAVILVVTGCCSCRCFSWFSYCGCFLVLLLVSYRCCRWKVCLGSSSSCSLEIVFGQVEVGLEFLCLRAFLVFEFACRRISFLSGSPGRDLNS